MSRGLQLLGIMLVALALAANPADAQRRRGDNDLEQRRQRWSKKSSAERQVLMQRYQELQRLSPEERTKLMERAQRLESLQRSMRETAPVEVRREIDSLEPERRERRWREHAFQRSRKMGQKVREGMPPELRERLENASPAERERMLEHFARNQEEMSRRAIRGMGRALGLARDEVRRMEALPLEQRLVSMMRLKRAMLTKRIEAQGLPAGLEPEAWRRMQSLSDEEFLQIMHAILPPETGHGRRKKHDRRERLDVQPDEDFSRNRRRRDRFQERERKPQEQRP